MIFLVPYAYDRMPDGKPRSGVPENRLGSKARIDALKDLPASPFSWVLVAGYSKESPNKPTKSAPASLAEDMTKYIVALGNTRIWVRSCAWGSYNETRQMINGIYYQGNNPDSYEVYTSTNLGHLPRVWLCWFFLKPKEWKVHFVVANHSFNWKERFQETAKFLVYAYRFMFRRW